MLKLKRSQEHEIESRIVWSPKLRPNYKKIKSGNCFLCVFFFNYTSIKWKSWKFYKFSNLLQYRHTRISPDMRKCLSKEKFLWQSATHYYLQIPRRSALIIQIRLTIHHGWYIYFHIYGHCFPSPVPNVTSILPSFAPGQISSITSQCLLTGSQSAEKQKILNYLQYYHKSTKQKSKRPNIQCNAQKRIFSKDVNHNAKKSQAFLAFPFSLRFCAGRVALLRWNTI